MALILILLACCLSPPALAYNQPSPAPAAYQHSTGPPPLPAYTPAPHITPHGYSPAVPSYNRLYGGTPAPYGVTPAPYGVTPAPYGVTPTPYPVYKHKSDAGLEYPACAKNTSKPFCLYDAEYPTYDIQHAIEYHYSAVASLYKDVIANTDNSVDRLKYISEETYLCPTQVAYEMPLRAVNTDGKWRIIVNQVKAHYETLSQTVRVEECTSPGHKCALVPECYETKCLQKSIYHRFLIYDPYEYYFPFSMESFKLPSACACSNGNFAQHY